MNWTLQNTAKRLAVILTLYDGNARALARKVGVHYVTMSRWVNGHRVPLKTLWPVLDKLETDAIKTYHLKQKREGKT